jgi:DNA-binding XRE family transcriptional regulator
MHEILSYKAIKPRKRTLSVGRITSYRKSKGVCFSCLTGITVSAIIPLAMTDRIYPDLETYFTETKTKQEDFAERVEISASYLSRIKNKLAQPPLDLALRISREAHVPLESLISEGNQ